MVIKVGTQVYYKKCYWLVYAMEVKTEGDRVKAILYCNLKVRVAASPGNFIQIHSDKVTVVSTEDMELHLLDK